jgi:hypothetical protein
VAVPDEGGYLTTDTQLARKMLTTCGVCFLEGPTARLREHIATDHKEVSGPDLVSQPHAYDHSDDAQKLGRRTRPRITQ